MTWQDHFLDLYMSDRIEDFSAALELKRRHLPPKLYRYRPATEPFYALDEICTGEIYLAHHQELNDPFDASSVMRGTHPMDYMGENDKAKYQETFQPKLEEDVFRQIFESDHWYDELMTFVAKESVPPEQQKRAMEALREVIMEQYADLNQAFNNMVHKVSRIACFTTKADNLPMWSHYAGNHTGICLEYETSRLKDIYMVNRLFPVFYGKTLPDILDQSLNLLRKKPPFGTMDFILIHKLADWSYEEEWRLIYNVGSWYFSPNDVPEDFWDHGKKIFFLRPSRVLLGAKMKAEHEQLVCQMCDQYHIPTAKMNITNFGLKESVGTET